MISIKFYTVLKLTAKISNANKENCVIKIYGNERYKIKHIIYNMFHIIYYMLYIIYYILNIIYYILYIIYYIYMLYFIYY